jgi:hypothetical protein
MGGVVDEYVDPAQLGQGGLYNGAAVVRLLYIASERTRGGSAIGGRLSK